MNTVNGSSSLTERLNTAIVEVPNFPKKGILFKDITPLLQDIPLFTEVITSLANSLLETLQGIQVDKLAALESRGFIFGMPLAQALNVPLVLVRKKGKLPPPIVAQIYQLEYGEATIEMQENAIHPWENVVIVDDILATGGTVSATVALIEKLGGKVVAGAFLGELSALKGRDVIENTAMKVVSLLEM